ncbi:PREDICTED: uncharacterized protein LOC109241141 [Nicotiana attenuata]|uniref:uncharacterized protein LOC109241141 n=1 Tax=Nicotiana attenuata TaxID=49451 RepID=UPI000904BD8C|nr:PREDICTED: uncharacterized protein LOC109241141 [Nicotiana attenuata]
MKARKESKRVMYDPKWKKVVWQLNIVFENVYKFREVVTRYAIERGCELEKITNDKNSVRVKCKTSGCPWLLFASREPKSVDFIIKTYNPRHNYNKTNTNSMCNTKYLAKYYRSLETSIERSDGDHVKEFGRIYDYRDVLLQSNPGSTCVVKVTDSEDEKKLFHSFYICFAAMKRRFIEGCRKCIGLDGCFLKGISKGELFVAIAKDGNNQIFPIAWAIVGTESKDTWCWFIRILKFDSEINDEGAELTIISDMQKGLYSAIQEYLPECVHRMCARHILANWQQKRKGIERRN